MFGDDCHANLGASRRNFYHLRFECNSQFSQQKAVQKWLCTSTFRLRFPNITAKAQIWHTHSNFECPRQKNRSLRIRVFLNVKKSEKVCLICLLTQEGQVKHSPFSFSIRFTNELISWISTFAWVPPFWMNQTDIHSYSIFMGFWGFN